MNIKKTLFSVEINIQPNELSKIQMENPPTIWLPLFAWLDKNFGFKLLSRKGE